MGNKRTTFLVRYKALIATIATAVGITALALFAFPKPTPDKGEKPSAMAPCSITALNVTPGSCNSNSNSYILAGTVSYVDPPSSGTLTVSVSGGGSQTFNLPFGTSSNFTIAGLTADGASHTVTATFSADTSCTRSTTYTAPASCGSASACNCQEYIYLNEPDINSVLKMRVNSDGSLTEVLGANGGTLGTHHWYPGTNASQLPAPHGLGTDLNGFLYIGETAGGNQIRKFDCDGTIFPETGTTINHPSNHYNMFSIDNTLYTTRNGGIDVFDLCTGANIGRICFASKNGTLVPNANIWGLSYNPVTETVYATERNMGFFDNNRTEKVWKFSKATLESSVGPVDLLNNCIKPPINAILEVGSDTVMAAGDTVLPREGTIHGIVGDNNGDFYITKQTLVNSGAANRSYVMKYNSNGAFVSMSPVVTHLGKYGAPIGLVWSEYNNLLYVSNFTDDASVDCISIFDPVTMNYVGTGAANPNLPVNNRGKAIAILKECCPVNVPSSFTRYICGGINERFFLNEEAFADCDGVVCGSSWTPTSMTGMVFNACDNSVTITEASGCGTFTLSTSNVISTTCGAQVSTFTICNTMAPVLTATPGNCDPATNTYTLTGVLTLNNPPATGSLTVQVIGGGSQVFNAPFTSPQNYSISGQTADGASHTITATYSENGTCDTITTYTAPANCVPICTPPVVTSITQDTASCWKGVAQSDGRITITTNAVKAGVSENQSKGGGFAGYYSNPLNDTVVSGVVVLDSLSQGTQYIIRLWSSDSTCYKDTAITTFPRVCPPCPEPDTLCVGDTMVVTAQSGLTGYQWLKDDSPIAGATSQTYVITTAGCYRYTAKDGNGCDWNLCCPVCVVYEVCATGSIGDRIWKDSNNNGLQDVGEPGIANIIVQLLQGTTVIATDTTDGSGLYLFSNLASGDYQVKILTGTLPAGCVLSSNKDVGADDAIDNDFATNGLSQIVTINAGGTGIAKDNLTVDAGLYTCPEPYKICSGDTVCATAQSGLTGYQWFNNGVLIPGATSQTLCVTAAGKYTYTAKDGNGCDWNLCCPVEVIVENCAASLGDYVWKDYNRNGQQDPLEPAIAGVLVTLLDSAGNVLQTQTTNGSGYYLFNNLTPNKYYIVRFPLVLPDGCKLTGPNQPGVSDSLDSDADGLTGQSVPVFLGPNQVNLTLDAGYIVPCPTMATIAQIDTACMGEVVTLSGTVTFEAGALPFYAQFCRVNSGGSYTPVGALQTVSVVGPSPKTVQVSFTPGVLDNGKTYVLKVTKTYCDDLVSTPSNALVLLDCKPSVTITLDPTTVCPGDYFTLNGSVTGLPQSLPFTYQFYCEQGGVLTALGTPMTVTSGTSPFAISQTVLATTAYHNKNFVVKITNAYTGAAGLLSNYVGPLNVRNSCCPTPVMKPVVGGCPGDFMKLNAEITSGVYPITYQFFCEIGGVYTPVSMPKTVTSGAFPVVISDSIIGTTAYNGKNFTIKAWSPLACPTGVYALGEGPVTMLSKCCPRATILDPLPQCVNDTFRLSATVYTPEFPFTYQFLCWDGVTYTPVGLAKTVTAGTSPVTLTSDIVQATSALNGKQYTIRVTTATCPYPGVMALTSEPLIVSTPCCPKPELTINPMNVCWGDKVYLNGAITAKEFPVTYQYYCEVGGVYTALTPARTLATGVIGVPIAVPDSFIATLSHNGKNITLKASSAKCPNGVYAVNAGPLTVRNNCCPVANITATPNNVCYGDSIHLEAMVSTPEFPLHYQFYCEQGGVYTPVSPALSVVTGVSPVNLVWEVIATPAFNGKNFTVKTWTNGICPVGVYAINAGPITVRTNCCPKIAIDSVSPQPVCIGEAFKLNATLETGVYPVSYQVYCEQGGNYTALEPPVTITSGTGTESIERNLIATSNLNGKNIVIKVWHSDCPAGVYSLNWGPFRGKYCRFDLALRKKIDFTATPMPFVPGSDVTFNIEVFNQGDIAAYGVEVTDYIPANFILNDASWTSVGGNKVTKMISGPIAPGTSEVISITLKIDPNYRGTSLVNTAEISKADNDANPATPNAYVDADSDPNNNQFDDGTPKNDMIDEDGKNVTGDDEDDHDIEPVQVDKFDLALTKKIVGTQPSYAPGDTVKFVIEVSNQGTIPANYIEVSEYIPSGLLLADNQWTTPVGNVTTRVSNQTLPPGASFMLNISFIVDPNIAEGTTAVNSAEISKADNDTIPGNGSLPDVDSWSDNNPNNDGTPKNDTISEDRKLDNTKDEDDQDIEPVVIVLNAELGDKVWYDTNGNGIQDAGELGVKDVIVCLYKNNVLFRKDTTDASGNYLFDKLGAGNYSLEFKNLPADYVFSSPDQGTNDSLDSDANPSDGKTVVTVLTNGEKDYTWDAGIYKPACLGNRLWVDLNGNGIQDYGEPGAYDVVVTLYRADGSVVATQNTMAGGLYEFCGLKPGDYYVKFALPQNFAGFTLQNQGTNDSLDSDVNPTGVTAITTLTSGERDTTWDAGLLEQNAELGDKVWYDTNGNGIQDAGELGVKDVIVCLYQGTTLVAKDTTDASGNYLFDKLAAGSYSLEFKNLPAGYVFSSADQGTNDSLDSDANPSDGKTVVTVLTNGEKDYTWDAGIYKPACLGNRLWVDLNKNGIQDFGEPGAYDVTVTLYRADGSVVATQNTMAGGLYEFCGLKPGDYYVKFSLPQNFDKFTLQNQGTNDSLDSDVDPNGVTGVTTLTSGERDTTLDAGLVEKEPTNAELGDRVWYDSNANGVQDAGELGVKDVIVCLYQGTTLVAKDTTDNNGMYLFSNLAAGSYSLEFKNLPSGYNFTSKDQGTNDSLDSDANPTDGKTVVTVLTNGEKDYTWDAGIYATACLGNRLWVDLNKNGIQDYGEPGAYDVMVTLYKADGSVVATQNTMAGGLYEFCGLKPGDYYVKFALPLNFAGFTLQNQGTNDSLDSDVNPTGVTGVTTLTSGERDTTLDAGLVEKEPANAELGDKVWYDTNGDGKQDGTEFGVPDVIVCLYQGTTLVAKDTTDASGNYLFTGLAAGSYSLEFKNLPSGYNFTSKDQGTNDSLDSDANPSDGKTVVTVLTNGEKDYTWDAGIYKPACIGNRLWNDVNFNGIQDAGEVGVGGATVTLYRADGSVVTSQSTTADGKYQFCGLKPGDYYVKFNMPAGFDVFSGKNMGSDPDKDSDVDPLGKTVVTTLTSGENDSTWDAGVIKISTPADPAELGDRVWFDDNKNGIQDNDELGVPNVIVCLYQGTTLVAKDTTDALGKYLFTGITPSTYTLEFKNLPSGYNFTSKDQGSDNTIDSDVDPATGKTVSIILTSGQKDYTWDAGIFKPVTPQLASLGDRVWRDVNKNGVQDIGEPGFANVTVCLLDAAGNQVGAAIVTDSTGYYRFDNLTPGQYRVKFKNLPLGYVFTVNNVGSDDNVDSDVNPATGETPLITLVGGQNDASWDAGIICQDANLSMVQSATNIGGGQILIKFHGFVSNIAPPFIVQVMVGDTNFGQRNFTPVSPVYNITSGVAPFEIYYEFIGTVADIGPDRHYWLIVEKGECGMYDPVFPQSSIGDKVWYDNNSNGLQDGGEPGVKDVIVCLYKNGTLLAKDTTDINGNYLFDLLVTDDYSLEFKNLPSGYGFTTKDAGNDAADSDVDPVTGRTPLTLLDVGENDMTWDAGLVQGTPPLPKASIGDKLFFDKNRNGVDDAGDTPIKDVIVRLYRQDGTLVATDTTDVNGNYLFTNVDPGCYHVQFASKSGYDFTTKDVGSNDAIDSDVNALGVSSDFCVVGGETKTDVDAGMVCHEPTVVPSITSRNVTGGVEITLTGIVTSISPTFSYQFCVVNNGVKTPISTVQTVSSGVEPFVLTYTFMGTSVDLNKEYVLKINNNDCSSESVLPVELVSFTGLLSDGTVDLSWKTASEVNNAGFELERSVVVNGEERPFEHVVFVRSQSQSGTSATGFDYGHSDDVYNLIGVADKLIYRLLVKDLSGELVDTKQRVEIELTDIGTGLKLQLSNAVPNPANTSAKFSYTLPVATKVTIGLYDASGKLVKSIENSQMSEGNHEVTMNIRELPSGVYRYKLDALGKSLNRTVTVVK